MHIQYLSQQKRCHGFHSSYSKQVRDGNQCRQTTAEMQAHSVATQIPEREAPLGACQTLEDVSTACIFIFRCLESWPHSRSHSGRDLPWQAGWEAGSQSNAKSVYSEFTQGGKDPAGKRLCIPVMYTTNTVFRSYEHIWTSFLSNCPQEPDRPWIPVLTLHVKVQFM